MNHFSLRRLSVLFSFPYRPVRNIKLADLGIIFLCLISTVLPRAMANSSDLLAVTKGNGEFTKQLFKTLSESEDGNIFFSPISAHLILSLAYQGAAGTTKDEFTRALGVASPQQAAEGYKAITHHLNKVEHITLNIANKIYIKNNYTLTSAFKQVSQEKFDSDVESVDFADNKNTAKSINTWVEGKTNNKIKDLISPDSIDADTRLVLVNAIYFKGDWDHQFRKEATQKEKFWLDNEKSVDVDMMNTKHKYLYKEDAQLDAKVLEMPYKNKDVSMIVILPNARDGIKSLEEKLQTTDLSTITENMYKVEVELKLPKFKIETEMKLNEPLAKMGLGEMFTEKANFTDMINPYEPLAVSEVIQKAFIEVNEEGAEAAAATGFLIIPRRSAIPQKFRADHPFVVLLQSHHQYDPKRRNKNSTTLLMGKIVELDSNYINLEKKRKRRIV